MSSLIVQKYGGTSVGSAQKIRSVAARIAGLREQGHQVVVVVSAMGHTTDEFIALAKEVSAMPRERELDMLLTAGERISMALLSMALLDLGVDAISFTGSQAGIITDDSHTRARILEMKPHRIQEELARGKVVIVAGFQGVSRKKEVTTLGRGGSDTTAVALAAALNADRCEILTDVSEIASMDPRLSDKDHPVKRYKVLPLEIVLEMACSGAQVMHPRALEIARQKNRDLFVGHSQSIDSSSGGTLMVSQNVSELPQVVAVTSRKGLELLFFSSENAMRLLEVCAQERVLVHDFVMKDDGGVDVLLDPQESSHVLKSQNLIAESKVSVGLICVIGTQMQQDCGVARSIQEELTHLGLVPFRMSVTTHSVRVLVRETPTLDLAVQALHAKLVQV